MSLLLRETRNCLSRLTIGPDDVLSASFIFPSEFPGFDGHFPGNPVLPGVCIVLAVLAMLESWKKTRVSLRSVTSAKWLAPVKPGSELQFVTRVSVEDGAQSVVKTKVVCGGEKTAELTMRVAYSAVGKEGSP